MVTISPGATLKITYDQIPNLTDGNGRRLNFKENKDNPGILTAKGRDGNEFQVNTKAAIVEVTANAAIDTKELRKRMPGIPLPKDEAKKLDDEIKEDRKEERKAAKERRKKTREEAVKNGTMTESEAKAQEKQDEENEKLDEEDEKAGITTTGIEESPEAESFKKRSTAPEEDPTSQQQAGRFKAR